MVAREQAAIANEAIKIKFWDLKDDSRFSAWEMETLRALRRVMPAGFLSSTRPVQADAQAATAGVKRGKRDMDSKQDATLLKLQALWDDTNNKVYEALEERLVLTESDVRTVRTLFGDSATVPFNGVKLWQWILSKRNICHMYNTMRTHDDELTTIFTMCCK